MEIEETDLSVEPEDLPDVSLAVYLSADGIKYDPDKEVLEIDGKKYYFPQSLRGKLPD